MDIETAQSTIKELGFDEKETRVYLALLKIGETTATKIARETRIERTLVYYIIEKLSNRGFVSFKIKNNVKYYTASSPDRILEELKEKEKSFQKILPFLEELQKQVYVGEVKVEVYKETAGLKTVIDDMFKHGKEFFVFGEEGLMQKYYPALYKQYLRRLKETGIKEKVLVREDFKNNVWKSKNSTFRYISKNLFSPTSTLIYADKTLITIWEKPMFNILITSKKVADSYISYFNHLWKVAKK